MSTLPQTQGQTIQDAWDYKGRPAERSKTGGWTSAAMILGLQFFPFFSLFNSIIILLDKKKAHIHTYIHKVLFRFGLFSLVIYQG